MHVACILFLLENADLVLFPQKVSDTQIRKLPSGCGSVVEGRPIYQEARV